VFFGVLIVLRNWDHGFEGLSPQLCVWCGELIGFLLALQDMGRLQLARAVLGAQRSWGSRSQPGLHRFYSSAATKASEPASSPSSSAQESPSASASEHAGGNVAEANVRSRTWDEHRLTADQLQFRSLASVGNQPSRRLCFCSPPGWITNFNERSMVLKAGLYPIYVEVHTCIVIFSSLECKIPLTCCKQFPYFL
jgi:hypothetical protein